jgi:site-specific DNA-methyltransferase (adenine-specific)
MSRKTHDSVPTADSSSARIADAPPETSSPPHIAPQLRALAVPIDSVELHPRNPRRGDVAAVAASLARFGQVKPIVVQRSTSYVIAGNHVLRAALNLGWTEIAANVEDLDDVESIALMLADNRSADLGGYDDTLLAAILAEQQAEDNLAATGYDADDVAALLAQAGVIEERDLDAAPDLPAEADVYVERGQRWALGRHVLMCGDATVADDVAHLTGDDSVDLVWTDPPYGLGYRGKTKRGLTIVNDDLGPDGTRALVAAALRLAPLRPGGVFYVAAPSGPELHLAFLLALEDAGLTAHQTLAWVKDRFCLGHADYHARHENLLYGWKDGRAHYFVKDRTQDTVWEIDRPARSTSHPTMKPVELVARAIRNSSTPGQLVYDPFAGSGSTLIAAEQTGRRCRAMELDPRYAQVILERWAALVGTPAERVA